MNVYNTYASKMFNQDDKLSTLTAFHSINTIEKSLIVTQYIHICLLYPISKLHYYTQILKLIKYYN